MSKNNETVTTAEIIGSTPQIIQELVENKSGELNMGTVKATAQKLLQDKGRQKDVAHLMGQLGGKQMRKMAKAAMKGKPIEDETSGAGMGNGKIPTDEELKEASWKVKLDKEGNPVCTADEKKKADDQYAQMIKLRDAMFGETSAPDAPKKSMNERFQQLSSNIAKKTAKLDQRSMRTIKDMGVAGAKEHPELMQVVSNAATRVVQRKKDEAKKNKAEGKTEKPEEGPGLFSQDALNAMAKEMGEEKGEEKEKEEDVSGAAKKKRRKNKKKQPGILTPPSAISIGEIKDIQEDKNI